MKDKLAEVLSKKGANYRQLVKANVLQKALVLLYSNYSFGDFVTAYKEKDKSIYVYSDEASGLVIEHHFYNDNAEPDELIIKYNERTVFDAKIESALEPEDRTQKSLDTCDLKNLKFDYSILKHCHGDWESRFEKEYGLVFTHYKIKSTLESQTTQDKHYWDNA
ncbi:MAG: hypothetical protein M1348_02910 [Candidatus Parvarchaeota archaeon]|jgi:hypothetical protein|nr:hypothetical protein [Candidatus Parvarchaeota archaeon]MCL5101535.1 hypothetical protein [Candidatus Parvarchaeota archaeon]